MSRRTADLSVCFVPIRRFTLSPFALMIDALRLASDEGDRSRQGRCEWTVMAPSLEPVVASCGTKITPFEVFSAPARRFDYVIVCGGLLDAVEQADAATLSFIRSVARSGTTLVGLCTGVFDLLRAGVMSNRRVCVSWFHYWDLLNEFPDATPVADQLFVVDGDRITCAGGVGAVDLAAWMINRHCGPASAQKSLHILQADIGRPPETPQPQPPGWRPVRNAHVQRALLMMEQNLSAPVPVRKMARGLGISERQLERSFQEALGVSPRRASLLMRLRFAMWLVTTSSQTLTAVAQQAGFSDLAHLSSAFLREYGTRPSALRSPDLRALERARPPRFLEPASGPQPRRGYGE